MVTLSENASYNPKLPVSTPGIYNAWYFALGVFRCEKYSIDTMAYGSHKCFPGVTWLRDTELGTRNEVPEYYAVYK